MVGLFCKTFFHEYVILYNDNFFQISSLQKVPSVLVLHLERFEFDYDAMCCVKNYSSVQIPLQLLVEVCSICAILGINLIEKRSPKNENIFNNLYD